MIEADANIQVEGYIESRLDDAKRHAQVMDGFERIEGHLQQLVNC